MILKIMILHCPSTHKQRLVLIFASSFRILISLLEATVGIALKRIPYAAYVTYYVGNSI